MSSKPGKRYRQAAETFDRSQEYLPAEAIKILKAFPDAKFDETVEIAFRLGIDPRLRGERARRAQLQPEIGQAARAAAEHVAELVSPALTRFVHRHAGDHCRRGRDATTATIQIDRDPQLAGFRIAGNDEMGRSQIASAVTFMPARYGKFK